MSRADNFTLEAYCRLLKSLIERGYSVRSYDNADPEQLDLILRHDVDMDLGAAVKMAEVEAGMGIFSTYFILMRSELYNPASFSNTKAIEKLNILGHQIGLHFDASLYNNDLADQKNAILSECLTLKQIAGIPINTFSFHRPVSSLVGKESPVDDLISAYSPRFVKEFAYVSDSRGGWHYGHPLDHEKVTRGLGLHLLTHPIWWVNPGNGPQAKLDQLVKDHLSTYRRELAANCKSYIIDD